MQTVGVLLIPCVVIPWWYNMTKQMKNDVNLNAYMFRSVLVSEIENTANLLHPINSSAGNLARVISSSLNRSKLSSSDIGNKVQIHLCIPSINIREVKRFAARTLANLVVNFLCSLCITGGTLIVSSIFNNAFHITDFIYWIGRSFFLILL